MNEEEIPVFGDVHGNIRGMFHTLQVLQKVRRRIFRYVLQVGDLGFLPSLSNVDCATKKRLNGPGGDIERGVHDYLHNPKIHHDFFEKPTGFDKLECKVYFVRGNHDDNRYLTALEETTQEGTISVDSNGKFFYVPDGRAISIPLGATSDIVVAGFGGISPDSRPGAYEADPSIAFSERGLNRLLDLGSTDVLLTHQGPQTAKKGHDTITALCETLQVPIHIHGHGHETAFSENVGETKSYALGKMPQKIRPVYTEGYVGILKANERGISFSPLIR